MTKNSNPRPLNLAILVVGTIAAVACAFGSAQLVRVGLVVALATAVAQVVLSWQQMNQMVQQHAAQLRQVREDAERAAREAAHAHHVESMQMITRFNARKAAYVAEIQQARAEMAELRGELTTATLDAEAKQIRISALNKRVSDLEIELSRTGDELHVAEEILNLPRRGSSRRVDLSKLPLVYPTEERRQA